MPVTNRFQNPGPPYHSHPEDNLEEFEKEAAPWLQLADEFLYAREKAEKLGDDWESHLPAELSRAHPIDLLLQIISSMERLACQKLTESVWYWERHGRRDTTETEAVGHATSSRERDHGTSL